MNYEHGVNSVVNRLREALGDKASNPRFAETLARRGYRFVAPVERIAFEQASAVGIVEQVLKESTIIPTVWISRPGSGCIRRPA